MAVSAVDVKMLTSLKPDDITKPLLISLFVPTLKQPAKYKVNEPMVIPVGLYKNNKEPIRTRLGMFIYNKFIIEDFYDLFGYINDPIDAKKHGWIEDVLAQALLDDKINVKQIKTYFDRIQWLAMDVHNLVAPSMTLGTMNPSKKIKAERNMLIKKYEKELKDGDVKIASDIEKHLLNMAAKELKDDPGMDLYQSGAKGSFNNNFKNMCVMKGPMLDLSTGKYVISTSNYMEGIKKEEIPLYADSIVNGAYAKGINTQVGGYMTKQLMAGFQNSVLDKPNSDCETKKTITIALTQDNISQYLYRYIVQNNKLVLIDSHNKNSFVGKVVKMRTPMYCTSDRICSKCAGELYYKLGIKNIGLTTTKVSSTIMNQSLKKFHDVTIKIYSANPEDLSL